MGRNIMKEGTIECNVQNKLTIKRILFKNIFNFLPGVSKEKQSNIKLFLLTALTIRGK
jgi:hypothetical protein